MFAVSRVAQHIIRTPTHVKFQHISKQLSMTSPSHISTDVQIPSNPQHISTEDNNENNNQKNNNQKNDNKYHRMFFFSILCATATIAPYLYFQLSPAAKQRKEYDKYQQQMINKLRVMAYEDLKKYINEHPRHLKYVDSQTRELALIAITADPSSFIFSKMRYDSSFCLEAVLINPYVILYMDVLVVKEPHKYIFGNLFVGYYDEYIKVITAAIDEQPYLIRYIYDVHVEYALKRGDHLWMNAVQKDWRMLEHCPLKYQNIHICRFACKQNPDAIRYVKDIDIQHQITTELRQVDDGYH